MKIAVPIISYLGFLAFISVCVVVVLYIAKKLFGLRYLDLVHRHIAPYSYQLAFFSALAATFASLFLSEVLHFQPCVLCWYQRILMYPQVIFLYTAQMRNEKVLTPYLLTINIIGSIIALYHYSLHILPRTIMPIIPCAKTVAGVPCDKGYEFFFGFMTFPLMAWSVFMVICILLLMSRPVEVIRSSKKRRKNA